MIVAYCGPCLPEKVILGVDEAARNIRASHEAHAWTEKNRFFPLSYKDWQLVYVEGDDEQTKANIIAQFGDRFV